MLGRHIPHSRRITPLLVTKIIPVDSHPDLRGRIDVTPHHGRDGRLNRGRVITRKPSPPIKRSIGALVHCSNIQDLARSCVGRALATRKRNAGVVLCEVEIHEAIGCGGIVLDEGIIALGSGGGDPAGAVRGGEPAARLGR